MEEAEGAAREAYAQAFIKSLMSSPAHSESSGQAAMHAHLNTPPTRQQEKNGGMPGECRE